MELERVIKSLEFKNDINVLNKKELLKKYNCNKEKALYFLHMFNSQFVARSFYPLMIYDRYDDITEIVNTIKAKYASDSAFTTVADEILACIKLEKKFAPYETEQNDRFHEMYSFKQDKLGMFKANGSYSFKTLTSKLLDEAKKLDECTKVNIHFPNKNEYEQYMDTASKVGLTNPYEEIKLIDKYMETYPLLKLCHEKDFLYLTSELLDSDSFTEKDELVDIALNVIDFSTSYHAYQKDCDQKEYNRIARKTIRNIKEYNKKSNYINKNNKVLRKIIM